MSSTNPNLRDRLPQKLRTVVERRFRAADHADSVPAAQAVLAALAGELDRTHPRAAASLREGLAETLTCCGWGCHPPWPGLYAARTASSR